MPTFTLDRDTHPFLDESEIGRCFSMDILFPGIEDDSDEPIVVTAWVGEFKKCLVTRALAERLGFDISSGECTGELVIQTYFEGDLVIHQSKEFALKFGKANHQVGEVYLHIDRSRLEELFWVLDYDALRPTGENLFFLVLRPRDESDEFCIEIPIEI